METVLMQWELPKNFDGNFRKRLANTFKFSSHDITKFILLLQNSFYPYEYMDDWKKLNQTFLPEKKGFDSHLNMNDIADEDYAKVRYLEKLHDL